MGCEGGVPWGRVEALHVFVEAHGVAEAVAGVDEPRPDGEGVREGARHNCTTPCTTRRSEKSTTRRPVPVPVPVPGHEFSGGVVVSHAGHTPQ
jgi:hypothetical protein